MDKNGNIQNTRGKPVKASRFKRWVKQMDEKDKSLSPMVRKSKWVLTLVGLIFLFVLSFIWFPSVEFNETDLKKPQKEKEIITQNQPEQKPFEMPVDSFENILKRNINEDIPEKE